MPAALVLGAVAFPGGGALASEGGGHGGGGNAEALHFVPMAEFNVPIIEADRVAGAMRLRIVLKAADGDAEGRLNAELPKLRSTALGAALEYARLDASPNRAVDVARLLHGLTDALHSADPGVARVLILEVVATRGEG